MVEIFQFQYNIVNGLVSEKTYFNRIAKDKAELYSLLTRLFRKIC